LRAAVGYPVRRAIIGLENIGAMMRFWTTKPYAMSHEP
jgi:hypothetical protein